jgi:inosine-uridine nucleoside N-ribohydrolase
MQLRRQPKPPVGIVFDTDMDIGDVLALALLYGFDGKNEIRVVSISVSKPNLKAAALCEVIGRFYAGTVSGDFFSFRRTLPVGLTLDGKMAPDTPMLSVPLAKQTAEGKPVYNHGIVKATDTAEPIALIRNAFTAQHDQNCIAVLAGPATNFAKVLNLPGAQELIAAKVRYLSLMGGAFPEGKPEFNIKSDIPAARKLFADWPTPIIASGFEIGEALSYPAPSIENDFAWSPAHPVADAYRAYKPMPYDSPTWDMSTVLYAVRPNEGYFKLSDPGTITVLDDGSTRFTPSPGGRHRYLILDPEQKERIIKTYIELASAKPVPRQPRFPREQQQQQDKPPEVAKPPAAKPPV